jgi:ATP-dependent RNA helicase DeaD
MRGRQTHPNREKVMAVAFESMHLRQELVEACRRQGFCEATPIQALVIPVVMQGSDVVVEAKTGSGKTLAYGLPLLNVEPGQAQFPECWWSRRPTSWRPRSTRS